MALVAVLAGCDSLKRHTETGLIEFDVLNLGDSYAAGNAATAGGGDDGYFFKSPDDPRAEADVRQRSSIVNPLTKDCFRNHNNYSETLYKLLGSSGAYINGACNGDKTAEMLNTNGPDGQLNGFSDAQEDEVDLITINIGGNDLHFADVVYHCFGPFASESHCNDNLVAAETLLANDALHDSMESVLDGLIHQDRFTNAKVVLVGYPLFWEGAELPDVHPAAGATPVQRLRFGLEELNLQQQALIDELNAAHPGRFAFLPLHKPDTDDDGTGEGFFDGHGINGSHADQWIQDIAGTAYVEEWVHPTASGHLAIARHLREMPFVTEAFGAKFRQAAGLSMTKIGSQWYVLDADHKLWRAHYTYVMCMMQLGFRTKAWTQSDLFAAATNQAPYPQLPVEDGVGFPNESACGRTGAGLDGIIMLDVTGSDTGYWRMEAVGYERYVRSHTTANVAQCHRQRGYGHGGIVGLNFFTDNPDTGDAYTDDTCWLTQRPVRDPQGNLWMVETWPSGPPTATIVRGGWMRSCLEGDSTWPGDVPTVNLSDLGVTSPDSHNEYQDATCLLWE